jgi:hypothetical protein
VDGGHQSLDNCERMRSNQAPDLRSKVREVNALVKLSWMTLARGARQLVVHEALDTTVYLGS